VKRLFALPLVLVAGVILAMGAAVPASAHTSLVGIDPAEGSTVAAGAAITLSFSETLLTIGAEVTVTDASGAATKLDVTFPTTTSARVVLPSMSAGNLGLAWRVVAGDGHPVEGTLAYVADAPAKTSPPSSVSATPGPTKSAGAVPPAASAPPSSATPSAAPSANPSGSSGFNNVALWIAIFAAILASSIAIIAAKRRR
jgi:methionine-rich copper-binding protein CopC